MGATTALFSVIDGVLLHPLPYPEPNQLVAVYQKTASSERGSASYLNFVDWQKHNRTFRALGAHRSTSFTLTGDGRAERVDAEMVSADLFPMLGITPIAGRMFSPEEDRVGGPAVVLIGEGLWKRPYAAARDILGRSIKLDANAFTIIGIVPGPFRVPLHAAATHEAIYFPIGQCTYPGFGDRSAVIGIDVIDRMKPGITIDQARSDTQVVADYLAAIYPKPISQSA